MPTIDQIRIRDLEIIPEMTGPDVVTYGVGIVPFLRFRLGVGYLNTEFAFNTIHWMIREHGADGDLKPAFDTLVREVPFPSGLDEKSVADLMTRKDREGLHRLLLGVADILSDKGSSTKRGTFEEFLRVAQAFANLAGAGLQLSLAAYEQDPKKVYVRVRDCWPVDMRPILKILYDWYLPTHAETSYSLGKIIRKDGKIQVTANRDITGHEKLEAVETIRKFLAQPGFTLTKKYRAAIEERLGSVP